MIRGFIIHLSLLTIIPMPKVQYNENDYIKAIILFPVIGFFFSILLYGFSYYLDNSFISSTFLYLFYIFLNGGIHFDGYLDTVDGFLARKDRLATLKIMKKSDVGSFGIIAAIFLVLLSVLIFNEINIFTIIMMPIISRINILFMTAISSYATEEGMSKLFVDNSKIYYSIIWIIILISFFAYLEQYRLILAFIITLFITFLIKNYSLKKIGGVTGDILGFTSHISELTYLIACYYIVI